MKKLIIFLVTIIIISCFAFIYKYTSQKDNFNTLQFTDVNLSDCKIIKFESMNNPESELTSIHSSTLTCLINGTKKDLITVTDTNLNKGYKNSIYKIWKNGENYRVLIVDSKGAGSGEGNGKLVEVEGKTDDLNKVSYKTLYCFYYNPDNFTSGQFEPLNTKEEEYIKNNQIVDNNNQNALNCSYVIDIKYSVPF